jgi:hypothetical protein
LRRDHPTRTSRVGRDNIRLRCARLDPARASHWRHPVVRLVGEYLLAYVSAIWRAPIGAADRMRCMRELAVWIWRHPGPRRSRPTPEGDARIDVVEATPQVKPSDADVLSGARLAASVREVGKNT